MNHYLINFYHFHLLRKQQTRAHKQIKPIMLANTSPTIPASEIGTVL